MHLQMIYWYSINIIFFYFLQKERKQSKKKYNFVF